MLRLFSSTPVDASARGKRGLAVSKGHSAVRPVGGGGKTTVSLVSVRVTTVGGSVGGGSVTCGGWLSFRVLFPSRTALFHVADDKTFSPLPTPVRRGLLVFLVPAVAVRREELPRGAEADAPSGAWSVVEGETMAELRNPREECVAWGKREECFGC